MDYSRLSPEELALACFRRGEQSAWAEFVRRFHPLIAGVVVRVARQWGERSPEAIDDLIQEVYLKICAERSGLLEGFTPEHVDSIFAFLKVVTANAVHDRFKASRSAKRGGNVTVSTLENRDVAPVGKSAKSAEATIERSILLGQVDGCLQGLLVGPNSERDRRIFWLYYRAGMAAAQIASLPTIGLSTKGVESILLRLTRQVRARLVAHIEENPYRIEGIRPSESL